MNLQEYDDNRYTKEKTEVEKYLLRIIQRYFDVENNFTNESKEAIIVESLTRFKRDILNNKKFIFSLNKVTGNINLTIRDIGGEYKFDKNSAFNKDFGTDKDTICEGNDTRLSDKREPNKHNHTIKDIIGLQELINSVNYSYTEHIHSNKKVLDILKYSGSLASIDLQLLEQMSVRIDKYYSNLQFHQNELSNNAKQQLEILDGFIDYIQQKLDNAKQIINNAIIWLDDIYSYIDNSINKYHTDQLNKLFDYIKEAEITSIENNIQKSFFAIYDGEEQISNGDLSFVQTSNKHTYVKENKTISIQVPSSIINSVVKTKAKVIFKYTREGVEYQQTLPFYFKDKDGHDIVIQEAYSKEGSLNIYINLLSDVDFEATKDNLFENSLITTSDKATNKMLYDVKNVFSNNISVCKIDSLQKEQFIDTLLDNNKKYLFQGICTSFNKKELLYIDFNSNELSYTNILKKPNINDVDLYYGSYMSYNTNNKMEIINDIKLKIPVLIEYKIPRITEYFENPRIYYQILGNKEDM